MLYIKRVTAWKITIKWNQHFFVIGLRKHEHYELNKGAICCIAFILDCHVLLSLTQAMTRLYRAALRVDTWFTITATVINFPLCPPSNTHAHHSYDFPSPKYSMLTVKYMLVSSARMTPAALPWQLLVHPPYPRSLPGHAALWLVLSLK